MFQCGSFTGGAKPGLRGLGHFKKVKLCLDTHFGISSAAHQLICLALTTMITKAISCVQEETFDMLCLIMTLPFTEIKESRISQGLEKHFQREPVFDLFNPQKTEKRNLLGDILNLY